ncbi:MAG: hypothetical protein DYH15_13975 [Nitrosomonas sp. PRO4]|nr:hypothetical protein [Nitrosomonas sp. PRO4]
MIISVSDHINLAMKTAERKLNSFTYPVFVNAKNERPDLIASSVIICLDSRTFLITASHVLDQISNANSPFYIATEGEFVALEGQFIRSVNSYKDNYDIAFIELDKEFVNRNGINSLREEYLMINKHFELVHLSLIHGYPCSKNKQGKALNGGTKFQSYAFTYCGKVDKSFNEWDKYEKLSSVHTCMNYGKARDINGEIITPPSPRGISGGGLWLVPNSFSPTNVYLEGIFIEYYQKDSISFSTKIRWIVDFIRNNV